MCYLCAPSLPIKGLLKRFYLQQWCTMLSVKYVCAEHHTSLIVLDSTVLCATCKCHFSTPETTINLICAPCRSSIPPLFPCVQLAPLLVQEQHHCFMSGNLCSLAKHTYNHHRKTESDDQTNSCADPLHSCCQWRADLPLSQ